MASIGVILSFVGGAGAGALTGTLGEYVMHRAMHFKTVMGLRHARHHRYGFGQGWLGELIDYGQGGAPLGAVLAIVIAWPLGAPALGAGFFIGVLAHMVFAAYAHQLQHERPELVFWMDKPVHHMHHSANLWRSNFGISTALWDHVFGTYEDLPFDRRRGADRIRAADFVQIDWGSPPKLGAARRQAWHEQAMSRARAERESRREARREQRAATAQDEKAS